MASRIVRPTASIARAAVRSFSSLPRTVATRQSLFALSSKSSNISASSSVSWTQTRGVKTLDFGGTKEVVYERSDVPPQKLQEILGKDTLAVIGYGYASFL